MSLKAFHIFFITVSVLLAFGFGGWSILFFGAGGSFWYAVMGVVSFVIGIVLIFYGLAFLHKLKDVRYL